MGIKLTRGKCTFFLRYLLHTQKNNFSRSKKTEISGLLPSISETFRVTVEGIRTSFITFFNFSFFCDVNSSSMSIPKWKLGMGIHFTGTSAVWPRLKPFPGMIHVAQGRIRPYLRYHFGDNTAALNSLRWTIYFGGDYLSLWKNCDLLFPRGDFTCSCRNYFFFYERSEILTQPVSLWIMQYAVCLMKKLFAWYWCMHN